MQATNTKPNVTIVANSQELAQEAVELFVSDARKAIESKERFCAAVSRHTPRRFFELLGEEAQSKTLLWDRIHLFWVDECCGSTDFRNNSRNLAAHTLIPKVGIPVENVHRICPQNRNCGYAASIYEQTIYNVVGRKKNGMPRFDLIMLGMAVDGHIASLFPDAYAFFDTDDPVCVIYYMDSRYTRITLTNPVLCAASHIAVLVSGKEKAATLREVLTGEPDKVRYPLHAIWPVLDKVTWLVDRSAAKFLSPRGQLNRVVRESLRSAVPSGRS